MHVLLVEDSDLIRSCLAEAMTEADFKVVEAPDAESALELAKATPSPQIIVSDVNLGSGMNGFEFVNEARRHWPEVAVVLISDVATNFAGQRCKAAERFLLKPFSLQTLLRNLTELTNEIHSLVPE